MIKISRLQKYILILMMILTSTSCDAKNKAEKFDLVLFATTDVHGSFYPFDSIANKELDYSLAHSTYYLNKLRQKKNTSVVYIDSGDYLQGDPVVNYFNNYAKITNTQYTTNISAKMMNYINPVSMTVGNHDIERGPQLYDEFNKKLDAFWLAANVIDKKTKEPYFSPYVITNIKGIKIAILGMLTPSTSHLPKYLWDKVEFEDIVESSKKWVAIIQEKEKPDLLIGSFHSGLGSDKRYRPFVANASFYTAATVEGFDIIFKGHDHITHLTNTKSPSGKNIIVLGGENAVKTAAQVTIPVTKKDGIITLGTPKPKIIYFRGHNKPYDKKFIAKFQNQFDNAIEYLSQSLGYLSEPVSSKKSLFGPSEFIDILHQMQFYVATNILKQSVDISISSPQIIADISTNVRIKDISGMEYFDNNPMILSLSGGEIVKLLNFFTEKWFNTMTNSNDYLLNYIFDKKGNFILDTRAGGSTFPYLMKDPMFSFYSMAGINYTINLKKTNNRVFIESMSDGSRFEINRSYNVIANSFLKSTMRSLLFLDSEEINKRIKASTQETYRTHLENYVRKVGIVDVPLYNNWKLIPEDWAQKAREREYPLWFTNAYPDSI